MTAPTVPKLNLAPKRRKPLSLWNPLDYLQLLGWVFFFPQALRWYVETFGENQGIENCKNWSERWRWWRDAPIQRSLWLQGLLLTTLTPFGIAFLLNSFGISGHMIGAVGGIALGVIFGVTGGVDAGVALGVVYGAVLGIGYGVTFGVVYGAVYGVVSDVSWGVMSSVTSGASLGIVLGASLGVKSGVSSRIVFRVLLLVSLGISLGILLGISLGLMLEVVFDDVEGIIGGIAFGVMFGASLSTAILRPEVWLTISLMKGLPTHQNRSFSHVTFFPLPGLAQQISNWLARDWMIAIENIHELLTYTQQFIPVVNAINYSLAKLPDEILLLRLSQLAKTSFGLDILQYASASLDNRMKERFIGGFFYFPYSFSRRLLARSNTKLRLDKPYRAAAAGFWYLHEGTPSLASEAFSRVRHLPHGKEMQQLAQGLSLALTVEQLNDSHLAAGLSIPNTPSLLRVGTWLAISRLRSVVDDAQIIYQSYSRSARSLALNRALGKLTQITKKARRIPLAERQLIVDIANSWQEKLLAIATDIGEVTHTQPVANPYVAGDPVEGSLFVGRGEIIKQLEELWLMSSQLQSVVLYGHRRMGKTSILKNISAYLGNNIQVAYVNLLNLGTVSANTGESEVLIAISDAISHTLSISPPKDEDLLTLPSVTFRRFIQSISRGFKKGQGLVIALDEFEKIEELIAADILSKDFLGFLRGILQEEANIAFAFAGLHTLEEMTEDYFNPLFASVLPIRVGFFSIGETRQLLANPDEDFTLDYLPDALNEIFRLTAGQPYLTQLLGFQLVRQYNHQVFDRGQDRNPIFTLEDLDTVIHHADFFASGRYYFTGVWDQASQDAPGQQEILKALANEAEGLSTSTLRRRTSLSSEQIELALKTLKRHDVVSATENRWKIIVPLFRQWVREHQ